MIDLDPETLIASWRNGRARVDPHGRVVLAEPPRSPPREKARLAYTWLTDEALRCAHRDLVFGELEPKCALPPESWASFALLPLLALLTSQRLLFVGAPGRGKTTMATLMGLVAGLPGARMRQAIQHGHPQLTVADLLGSPLPSELIRASDAREIRVAWRGWLSLPVKVIDEYNRIPTKTQSALLSLMAEGYAEMYEQTLEIGRSAWFLTANDDEGGGTFPVIEALRDRIDLTVRCSPVLSRELDVLEARVVRGEAAGGWVPADVQFGAGEIDAAEAEIRALPVGAGLLDILGFFAGQLDFCQRASDRPEFRSKDTLHIAGRRVAFVCNEDCPLDKQLNLCTRTENGISARATQSLLLTAKAMAWFRGQAAVTLEDLRQVLPWVLHDKVRVNPASPWFQQDGNGTYLLDRAAWLTRLFDDALVQHAAFAAARAPAQELRKELADGPGNRSPVELDRVAEQIAVAIRTLASASENNGSVNDDLLLLRDLHARCRAWARERRR